MNAARHVTALADEHSPHFWLGRLSTALAVAPDHPKVAREALEEFVRSPLPSRELVQTLRERMTPK